MWESEKCVVSVSSLWTIHSLSHSPDVWRVMENRIEVKHYTNPPTDGSRCLLCLDPLESPWLEINVGAGWRIKVDENCWNQLVEMVEAIKDARKGSALLM